MKRIQTGDNLIIDGLAGRVFVNPSPLLLREYDSLEDDLRAHHKALENIIPLPTVTRDGTEIKLCANVGKVADALKVAALNADGIGLYRTEFMFLAQDHFPSEEEQYRMYCATADRVKPRDVVIRAVDLGSDKRLPYFPLSREDNPSLGHRGTRLLLKYPDIMRTQLRAILRLSATHPVRVLFPMIGDVEELLAAKAVIKCVKADLDVEGQPYNHYIPVGAMIETPSAVILARRLAQHADFFSIGSNDLVQYLLASDRTNREMAAYYEPLHPAVLQTLALLTATAREAGKPISICGEMAGNPMNAALLLGLGFRTFSVNAGEMLEIKNVVRSTTIEHAEALARKVLDLQSVQEIKMFLGERRGNPEAGH